jgi:methionyl-tRNA formyltransferase
MERIERIAFFGTPEFALPALQALCSAGREPAVVVTQPDRPAGRGQGVQAPAVARWARERGLAVWQPAKVREREFLDDLGGLELDLAVVVAFGQIFPRELLALPRRGCVNLHASLLPRHRGAAPVQASLLAGDEVVGVSTMVMEEGLDSGPVLLQASTRLAGHETAGELLPRLAYLGAALMLETVARLEVDALEPQPQRHEEATLAPRLRKEDGRLDWGQPAVALARRLRALTPWPGVFAELRGEPVKVLAAEAGDGTPEGGEGQPPGTVLALRPGALLVATGAGALAVTRLQKPGRKAVGANDFANGERLSPGERFA